MLRRWAFAALLGGVLFSAIGGGAAVLAFPPGPEWNLLPGANPALLAFLEPSQAGRVDLRSVYLANPLRLDSSASYAVPDTGYGAAAVVVSDSRSWVPGLLDATDVGAYYWSRRWRPELAAGVALRWQQHQFFLDGFSTPVENGVGLDIGAIYAVNDGTWVGVVVRDVFDTTLRSAGGSASVLPQSFDLSLERRLTPALRLLLEGRDVTGETAAGTSFRLAGALERGSLGYRLSLTSGTEVGWSVGVTLPLWGSRLDLAVTGTGQQSGATLGVSSRW